ncbi:Cellulose synthase [Corchorus olitorius]|uniref:Cellulose synthase n=1 Tax=Corchorus olitorius TaxID=93759 RepID=A0A1R3HXJ7_9ROSI|nr:Cellulose synthase [Corchorus olitorius]
MMHQQYMNQDPLAWWKTPIKLEVWERHISFASFLLAVILCILKGCELHFEEAGKEEIVLIILKTYCTTISGFMISFSTAKIYSHPWVVILAKISLGMAVFIINIFDLRHALFLEVEDWYRRFPSAYVIRVLLGVIKFESGIVTTGVTHAKVNLNVILDIKEESSDVVEESSDVAERINTGGDDVV